MPIERLVPPRSRDLGGGFMVRRLLPAGVPRQGVGPFVFFDHFGPVTTRPGDNHDVRPHPHIGLATVTYLFEGAMMHRDSLGSVQRIEPGAINWMTAGRGIVHSERTPPDLKQKEYVAHGLQLWAALPKAHEETAPDFAHTPATAIPDVVRTGDSGTCTRRQYVRITLAGYHFLGKRYTSTCRPIRWNVGLAAIRGRRFEQAIYSVDEPLQIDGENGAGVFDGDPGPRHRGDDRGTTRRALRRNRWGTAGCSAHDLVELRLVDARIGSRGPRPIGARSGWAASPVNTTGFRCHNRGEVSQ